MTTVANQPRTDAPAAPKRPRMGETQRTLLKRFVACLFGGFVLATMVGTQEGSQDDFGISFHKAVLNSRILVFLGIGVVMFAFITFWGVIKPYVRRPGMFPLLVGLLAVIAALTIMNWYDPLVSSSGDGKFGAVRDVLDKTPSGRLAGYTEPFFGWLGLGLAWIGLLAAVITCGLAVVLRNRLLGYLTAAIAVVLAAVGYFAHSDVVNVGGGPDHSLGVYVLVLGFLVVGGAGITAVHSHSDVANRRRFIEQVMTFRPGLPFALVAMIYGLFAYLNDCWYDPQAINADFAKSGDLYKGTGISSLASAYLSWLGWALFIAAVLVTLAASWFCQRVLAMVSLVLSLAGVVVTFFAVKSMTEVAAKAAPDKGSAWKNLGVGGFAACITFVILAAAAVQVLLAARRAGNAVPDRLGPELPITKAVRQTKRSSIGLPIVVVVAGLALFYPPMLPTHWQDVLVGQIGVYVLLALGLNVVVGWAGLLDLGYIAFYEVGAYTTAYLTGALPVKPPDFLHFMHGKPLETIPFAILACLIAGVLLGGPTLRLRGDYLAIVTLGFGEIVQVIAVNWQSFTGGPQGPNVNHPSIHVGRLDITWGQDELPYWYLLLIMVVIVVVLFYRLEGSRLGRAWAAIREDEVAAQATGVNTVRVKLLAFAIGASTSGLSGVFFASKVGYFDPSLFTLQTSILILAYVVFGGMGSLPGAMAGAAVLTWLPEFLKAQVPTDDRQMWVGALLLIMMIFRPAGLLPARRRKAELEGLDAPASSEVSAVPASEGM